jgi:hypothetical protein
MSGGSETRLVAPACVANWVTNESAFIDAESEWLLIQIQGTISVASRASGEVRPVTVPASPGDSAAPLHGSSPRFVPPRYLVFVRGSTLFAAPFNPRTLRLEGTPRAILANVRREQTGQAHYALSGDGTIVWAEGGDASLARFVWVGQNGRVADTLFVGPAEIGSYALSPDGKRLAYSIVDDDRSARLMIAYLDRGVVDSVPYPQRLDPYNWLRGGRALGALVIHPDLRGHGAIVQLDGPTATVDTASALVRNESANGALACLEAPTLFTSVRGGRIVVVGTGSGSDSLQVDVAGNWCRFSPDARFVAWNS